MFQFMHEGSVMSLRGAKAIGFVEYSLPQALGGIQRWSLDSTQITFDGEVYNPGAPIISYDVPSQSAEIREDLSSMVLSDPDNSWSDLLENYYTGIPIHYRMLLLDANGNLSTNALTLDRGFGWSFDAQENRSLTLGFGNEFTNINNNIERIATNDEQRRRNEDDNSLQFIASAVDFKWGLREQSRRT